MPSLNKVILIGHLGGDPEIKYLQSGVEFANVKLATNESYKGKDGEWKQNTEWHNLVAYGKVAEILWENFKKGNLTYIEGKLRTRSWEDKEGAKRYITEIVIFTVKNLTKNDKPKEEDRPDEDIPF